MNVDLAAIRSRYILMWLSEALYWLCKGITRVDACGYRHEASCPSISTTPGKPCACHPVQVCASGEWP